MTEKWDGIPQGQSWRVGPVGDTYKRHRAVVEEFIRQRALRCPYIGLRIVTFKAVRVLNDIMPIEYAASCNVQFVVDNCGAVVHPALLKVFTFDKLVGLSVIGDHPTSVTSNNVDLILYDSSRCTHILHGPCLQPG